MSKLSCWLFVLACACASHGGVHETGRSINPNPRNASLEWAGDEYLVWRTTSVVRGTAGMHLPRAVFRYYVQGHPEDVVPPVYEMSAAVDGGARVLGVVGPEATLVLAEYGRTVLVNTSEALGLPDPKAAIRVIPSDWYTEPRPGAPPYGVPLAAYEEGVLASGEQGRRLYLIPWAPGRGGLDVRAKVPAGDLGRLEEHRTARDLTYLRGGDLVVWAAAQTLYTFDPKTGARSARPLAADVLAHPLAFDGTLVVFALRGGGSAVYDARAGRRLTKVPLPPAGPANLLWMKDGVVYLLEREEASDREGRHAYRVAAHDLKAGGARRPVGLLLLKADARRAYLPRLHSGGQIFLWDGDRWESIGVD